MARKKKDPFHVETGKRIRQLREMWCLTQEQLAEKVERSANFIGSVERGEYTTSVDTLRQIAAVFGVEVRDLLDFPSQQAAEKLKAIKALLDSREWDIEDLRYIYETITRLTDR